MSFNYSEYYNNALIIPLIFLIISLGFTGGSIFNYIRTKNKESLIQSKNKKPLILMLISVVVCYIIISTQTTTLIYGINLTVESVEDAVEYVGEVKSIVLREHFNGVLHVNDSVIIVSALGGMQT